MLGLANTVSSSSTPESKYSLNFEGSDDYIDLGDTFQSTFRGDYSISFWLKPDDGQSPENVFGADNDADDDQSNSDEIYFQLQNDGKPRFVVKSNSDVGVWSTHNGGGFTFDNGAASSWTHFVITADIQGSGNSIIKIYVNGVDKTNEEASLTSAQHANYTSNLNIVIGAKNTEGTVGGFYGGGLDDFAIWNVALDADAVTAIYNSGRPTNLTFDDGDKYDNSSALVAYYRMGNGSFDDKANGVVHDQHAPGFGAEALTNGDFETDGDITADSWSLGWAGLSDAGAAEGVTIEDGLLVIHNDGTANDGRVYATNGSSSQNVVTSGKIYKLTYTIVEILGASVAMKYHTGAATVDLTNEQETVGTHTIYYRAAGTVFILYQLTSGSTVKLSEVSLKPLNGFPGLTSGGPTFISDTP